MGDRELLREQWRCVSRALGIAFVAPVFIGSDAEFACLLPEFGGPRGMLIDVLHNANAVKAATAQGYYCSSMLPETRLAVVPDNYIDCLEDWGWADKIRRPPTWYKHVG